MEVAVRVINQKISFLLMIAFLVGVGFISLEGKANAVVYEDVGAGEYLLPIEYDVITAYIAYNIIQDMDDVWDGEDMDATLLVNANKLTRFYKIPALPEVGLLFEAVLGWASFEDRDANESVGGMFDPLVGHAIWINPIPSWTTGFEYWLHVPLGDNDLSDHGFKQDFVWINHNQFGDFGLDWDLGYRVRHDAQVGGDDIDPGDSVFANVIASYKVNDYFIPTMHWGYESRDSGDSEVDGKLPSSDEEYLGFGNAFKITEKLSSEIWYSKGISGRNTVRTDSFYLRFQYIF
jgi:Putative MetA-pathway of phenol degradation